MMIWIILYFVVTFILSISLSYFIYKKDNENITVLDILRGWFVVSIPFVNIGGIIWLIFNHFNIFEIVVFKRKEL